MVQALKDTRFNEARQAGLVPDGQAALAARQTGVSGYGLSMSDPSFKRGALADLLGDTSVQASRSPPCTDSVAVEIRGFSAGSYTGIMVHRALASARTLLAVVPETLVGAIAIPPCYLVMRTTNLTLVHLVDDRACIWNASDDEKQDFDRAGDVPLLAVVLHCSVW